MTEAHLHPLLRQPPLLSISTGPGVSSLRGTTGSVKSAHGDTACTCYSEEMSSASHNNLYSLSDPVSLRVSARHGGQVR